MPVLRDIMSSTLVTLAPDATLREAAELLSDRGIGGAPVVAGGRLVGVVSATDILDFTANSAGVPTEKPDEPDRSDLDFEWEEALDDEGAASFFVDLWDDAGADVLERMRQVDSPEWDLLEEHAVEEVMTRRVSALPSDADIHEAAQRMLDEGIHRLLVIDGERLVGVVTTTDFLRLVATRTA